MRAGPYAEYQGRVYRSVSLNKPNVRLLVPGSEPCPEGFDRNAQGQWTRLIRREEASRLFEVSTTAVWRGYRVEVDTVDAGVASFRYFGTEFPQTPTITRFQADGWSDTVPVEELEDAVETVHDVPI